jgi:hypothetical protein
MGCPQRGCGPYGDKTALITILRTLSVATSRAHAAPGILKGSLYLTALNKVPVTNLVSVTRLDTHGPRLPAMHSYNGQFSATLPPGRYRLNGHDGNAPCPQLAVRVRSGLTTQCPFDQLPGRITPMSVPLRTPVTWPLRVIEQAIPPI